MEDISILGIKITTQNKKAIKKTIDNFLSSNKVNLITTPNPEIILKAQRDEELFYVLNLADLSIADGFGVKLAAWLSFYNITRFPGVDLSKYILEKCQSQKKKVVVLNWEHGLSAKNEIKAALLSRYPGLNFKIINIPQTEKVLPKEVLSLSRDAAVVFCNLGAPWQEKVLYKNFKKFEKANILIGVGGTFDFLTNKRRRAVFVFRFFGLEWLWRLIIDPKRLQRIFNAVFVFLWTFFKWKFINRFLFRPNVSCILYKVDEDKIKVLLLNRNEETDHWQLPQGGKDGMSAEDTGRKELSEELGTEKFKTVAIFKKVHNYLYNKQDRNDISRGNRVVKRRGYKGQEQDLYIARYYGEDLDIKIKKWEHKDWKWIDIDNLIFEVHPVRKEGARKFLHCFKQIDKKLLK